MTIQENDIYIEDYLFFDFRNPSGSDLRRDYQVERKVIQASRLEFFLQHKLNKDNIETYLGNKVKDQVYFTENNLIRYHDNILKQLGNILPPDFAKENGLDVNEFPVSLPLISLYKLLEGKSFDDAIANITRNIQYNKIELSKGDIGEILSSDAKMSIDVFYSYFSEDKTSLVTMRRSFQNGKKVVLPCFMHYTGIRYFFFPSVVLDPIFNKQWLLKFRSAIVILTDSIDLAANNQCLLAKMKKYNIVWISWYSENNSIDKVDWTPLKSRQVYYLLKEHSGFTAQNICKRALAVEEKLKTIDVELRYVSLLCFASSFDRRPGFDQRSPMIVTSQMIHDYINNAGQSTTSFDHSPHHSYFKLQLPGRKLISPFIYERTVTLVYGYPGVDLSWFALSLAFALANKMTFFNDWQAIMPGSVLYLRALDKSASTTLEEKIKILKEFFHKTVKATPNVIFCDPEINRFPNQQQTSCFYVSEIDEGSSALFKAIGQVSHQVLLKLEGSICNFVTYARNQGKPTLIVLDGFSSLFELAGRTAGRAFLMKLKELDCAIVIIPPADMVTSKNLRQLKEKLPIDSIIQIAAADAPASALGMSVHIEKGFKISATDAELIRLELDLIDPQWSLVQAKQSWEDEIIQIIRLQKTNQKMTAKQIAHTLGIPLSRTKLRLRQIEYKWLRPKKKSKAAKSKKALPLPSVPTDENKQ